MKLIQAMKKLKDLAIKAEDLRSKVGQYCADLSIETPAYPNQAEKIAEWTQAHADIIQEILKLRVAIQMTNLATPVTIELGGKPVVKTIAEWIHIRRDLSKLSFDLWSRLGDRKLKETNVKTTQDGPVTEIRIRRYFDIEKRDKMLDLYRTEPSVIDAALEVINAVTDLIDAPQAR